VNAHLVLDRLRIWPRSLSGRLTLILFFGLIVAHALSFGLTAFERFQASRSMMMDYLARDIASSVAILERLPATERASWLARLERNNYRYLLSDAPHDIPVRSAIADRIRASLTAALGPAYQLNTYAVPGSPDRIRAHMQLSDGRPLAIEMTSPAMSVSGWLPLLLLLQLALLAGCTLFAVRLATRPLMQLAQAADALGSDLKQARLAEDGPLEVARASAAFNAMQKRIADLLTDRVQILAAISHDLKTPITRMRLRADLMDDESQRAKLHHDLDAMQVLVEEGIDYARSAHSAIEPVCSVDLDALLESVIFDYKDAGKTVGLNGHHGRPLMTRPNALRRIICNLTDNGLKFASDVSIELGVGSADHVSISVLDRGPGIPEEELQAVLAPFYRLENSRSRDTGGTGLGLAIVHQLVAVLGGTLVLSNRTGGGLEAQVSIPS
jgi:signal transduction histidine kinase